MLTPIDIQNKTLKAGMGYKKSDVDVLLAELFRDYEALYKKNAELKDRVRLLSDGVQYYKNIEKTIQGALVLAQQTAEQTQHAAETKAKATIDQAKSQADRIVSSAEQDKKRIENQTIELIQEYERYRLNFRHRLEAQMELLESDHYNEAEAAAKLREMMKNLNLADAKAADAKQAEKTDADSMPAASEKLPTDDAIAEVSRVINEKLGDTQEIRLQSISTILSRAAGQSQNRPVKNEPDASVFEFSEHDEKDDSRRADGKQNGET